ncbi:MAG: HlyD family efflux transporter periplasmic adaptor subunit [Pseudomonadota bacterium]
MSDSAKTANPSHASIFRPEALEGLRTKYGKPVPLFGLGSWVIVSFMMTVLVVVGVFLIASNFARAETVSGQLQPASGSADILATRAGRIAEVYVQEGQNVTEGQPLMRISVDQALDQQGGSLSERTLAANKLQAIELEAALAAGEASNQARHVEIKSRISGSRAQIEHLNAALVLAQKRTELEQENLDGIRKLEERGFAPSMRVREQEAQVLALSQSVAETQRQIAQTRSDILAMEAALAQVAADNMQSAARMRSERAALAEQKAKADADSGFELLAPYNGRVVTMRSTIGKTVDPSMTLATILPENGRLEAILWVPSRAIGFVKPGDDVRLMFDPFPFERFGTGEGKVMAISSTPVAASEVPVDNAGPSEALYRVRVRLAAQSIQAYGKKWVLVPGSRLQADLILERQSLFDWLLDPLRAFRQRSA